MEITMQKATPNGHDLQEAQEPIIIVDAAIACTPGPRTVQWTGSLKEWENHSTKAHNEYAQGRSHN